MAVKYKDLEIKRNAFSEIMTLDEKMSWMAERNMKFIDDAKKKLKNLTKKIIEDVSKGIKNYQKKYDVYQEELQLLGELHSKKDTKGNLVKDMQGQPSLDPKQQGKYDKTLKILKTTHKEIDNAMLEMDKKYNELVETCPDIDWYYAGR